MADSDQLKALTSTQANEVFNYLAEQSLKLAGLAADGAVFHLQSMRIENNWLYLLLVPPYKRPLLAAEELTLTAPLESGYYFIQAKMALKGPELYGCSLLAPVRHLQRRSSFRANVPRHYPVTFLCQSVNQKPEKHLFKALDLSAGGAGLQAERQAPPLAMGDIMTGQLQMPDFEDLELTGKVIRISAKKASEPYQLGLEFQDSRTSEQQRLVMMCLKLSRLDVIHE